MLYERKMFNMEYAYHSLGYETVYVKDGAMICASCINKIAKEDEEEAKQYVATTYWEGTPMECEECGEMIQSIYGDPDEED